MRSNFLNTLDNVFVFFVYLNFFAFLTDNKSFVEKL